MNETYINSALLNQPEGKTQMFAHVYSFTLRCDGYLQQLHKALKSKWLTVNRPIRLCHLMAWYLSTMFYWHDCLNIVVPVLFRILRSLCPFTDK